VKWEFLKKDFTGLIWWFLMERFNVGECGEVICSIFHV
jgi:hypothetical protein